MLEEELKGKKKCYWMSLEAEEVCGKAILTTLEAHARRQLKCLELVATTQGQNPGMIFGKAKVDPARHTGCRRAGASSVQRSQDRGTSIYPYIIMQFKMQINIKKKFPNKKDAIKFEMNTSSHYAMLHPDLIFLAKRSLKTLTHSFPWLLLCVQLLHKVHS